MFGTERTRLAAAGAIGLLCGLLLSLPGLPAAIAFPAAALLVLVLPGYTVSCALFGRRNDPAEQVTLTVGLSLSIAILGGLVLNLSPHGLSLPQWGGLLGGITVVAGGIAWLRGVPSIAGTEVADRPTAELFLTGDGASDVDAAETGAGAALAADAGSAGKRIPRTQLVMLGAAACLLLTSLGVARLGAAVEPHEAFTQLWMVPDVRGTFVELGIKNDENRETTYRLLVTQDGRTIAEWTELILADGGSWEQVLALNFRRDTHRIRTTLYRTGDTEPYRETHADVRYRPNAGQTPLPSGVPSGAPATPDPPASGARATPDPPASGAPATPDPAAPAPSAAAPAPPVP